VEKPKVQVFGILAVTVKLRWGGVIARGGLASVLPLFRRKAFADGGSGDGAEGIGNDLV